MADFEVTAAREEWSRSTGGKGPAEAGNTWSEMVTVSHNTHLSPALRIAEDRCITGGLIYEGKLGETRSEFVYLTPKTWGGGSIYGSFCFEAEWKEIATNRALYWVEEKTGYQTPICRFLLSWYDVTHLPVTRYDPELDNGPLRLVDGRWFWLNSVVPEIVVDDPIHTISLLRLTFDTHRDEYCHHTRGANCRERGAGGSGDAHTSFVARLLGDESLGMDDLIVMDGSLTFGVYNGFASLWRRLFGGQSWGGPVADDVVGVDLVSSACLAYHFGDRDRARRLIGQMDTEARADRLFLEAIRTRLSFPTFNWND